MDDIKGSGTEKDPYKIESFYQLQYINQELDACYKLVSDIDATNTSKPVFTPIGELIVPFTGTFDGNDHQIANLCIKQPNKENVGLFGWIGEEGEVRNVGLTNATIQGGGSVGGLVVDNYGKVESCCIQGGDVSGDKVVGGLVHTNSGVIESSYVQGVDVSGHLGVGGLVGENHREVKSSYVQGVDVSGTQDVGGLIACNHSDNGIVGWSYVFNADVSGEKEVGGLVGVNWGEVESSYTVDNNISGDEVTGSCVGRNVVEDVSESCFTMSSSNKPNIPGESDLIISRRDHRIFYDAGKRKLFTQFNGELYSSENVSPIEMQSLVDRTEVVKMTQKFMSSLVITT